MHFSDLKILLLWSAILSAFVGKTQETEKQEVALLGRSYAEHIELRYFPTTASLFNKANRLGYIIEKAMRVDNKQVSQLSFQPLKGSPFRRWTDEQWQSALSRLDKSDTNQLSLAGFAMGLTGADASQVQANILENDLQSLKQNRDNADNNFSYVMLATSRSKLAAEGCGLRISDSDVKKGSRYVYRIRINEPGINKWAYLEIQCTDFIKTYLQNDKAIVLNEGDKMINLTFPESEEYFAFNVYRSADGGATYNLITNEPSVKLKPEGYEGSIDYGFNDSGLINYKKYHYRLMVITPFADELLLSEFTAIPKDKTAPTAPFLKSAEHIEPKKVKITWEVISDTDTDMKGFVVSRSNDEKGGYVRISKELLPTSARTYTDESFTTDGTNYYVVDAIDSAGNLGRSFPAYVTLIDSTPPAIPVISTAVIDSLGKVIIRVQPNKEKDFIGYQLSKANAADHEFSVVEETYKDSLGAALFILYDSTTLKTLTSKIYYKLVAFDSHFNQSLPSKIIELTRRDTIPPVSPLIIDYQIDDSSVTLRFANSESEDVAENFLLRRQSGKQKFDTLFTNKDTSVVMFIDRKIVPGGQYEYTMTAKDDAGLSSRISNIIQLKTLLNNRIPAPVLSGTHDEKEKKIFLSFVVSEKLNNRKLKIEIYKRADESSTWMPYKTIVFEKGKAFQDEYVAANESMSYIVKLTDENNNSSNFSNEVIFKF